MMEEVRVVELFIIAKINWFGVSLQTYTGSSNYTAELIGTINGFTGVDWQVLKNFSSSMVALKLFITFSFSLKKEVSLNIRVSQLIMKISGKI